MLIRKPRVMHLDLVLATVLACAACAILLPGGSQVNAQSKAANDLLFKAPAGWVSEKPGSSMRVAQYKLPKNENDPEDASLVLYYFGSGQGGSVQTNIDRWIAQIEQPGGGVSKDQARTDTLTINGLKVTTVDVAGTYVAEISPGSSTHNNKPGYRLRAAVIETPKGPYFVKLVGPEKTVSHWEASFNDYLRSFEFK